MQTLPFDRRVSERGISLIEVLVVVGLLAVMAGISVLVSSTAIRAAQADSAIQQLVRELRTARELAISERRNMQVAFVSPNQVVISRRNVTGNVESGVTVVRRVTLEGKHQYLLPSGAADTPDGFGTQGGLKAVDFGDATAIIFTSEGTLVDQTGDPRNGTVFMSVPDQPQSLRAVTLLGATALVRTYAWNGTNWVD